MGLTTPRLQLAGKARHKRDRERDRRETLWAEPKDGKASLLWPNRFTLEHPAKSTSGEPLNR